MDRSRYCYILLVQGELLADVMDCSLDFVGSAFEIPIRNTLLELHLIQLLECVVSRNIRVYKRLGQRVRSQAVSAVQTCAAALAQDIESAN